MQRVQYSMDLHLSGTSAPRASASTCPSAAMGWTTPMTRPGCRLSQVGRRPGAKLNCRNRVTSQPGTPQLVFARFLEFNFYQVFSSWRDCPRSRRRGLMAAPAAKSMAPWGSTLQLNQAEGWVCPCTGLTGDIPRRVPTSDPVLKVLLPDVLQAAGCF